MPSRTFTYQAEPAAAFTEAAGAAQTLTTNYGTPTNNDWCTVEGDFAGNGRTDFAMIYETTLNVYMSNGDGTFNALPSQSFSSGFPIICTTAGSQVMTGDINGDGKTDFVEIGQYYTYAYIGTKIPGFYTTFLSNGNGTFTVKTTTLPYGVGPGSNDPNPGESETGDFVGNGRTDVAFFIPNSQNGLIVYTYLSNGDGTYRIDGSVITSANLGNNLDLYIPIVGDLNGDGKTDVAFFTGTSAGDHVVTFLSKGDGTFSFAANEQFPESDNYSPPNASSTPVVGDFNGDGLMDIAFVFGGNVATYLSTGNGPFTLEKDYNVSGLDIGKPPSNGWSSITGDFNGDGKTDMGFVGNNNHFEEVISNGDGTYNSLSLAPPNANWTTTYNNPPSINWSIIPGDFAGSGTTDLATLTGTTLLSYINNQVQPDFLTSLSNGIGASTNITYSTLPQGWGTYYSGWTSSTCSGNPAPPNAIDVAFPMPLVTSTASSTGISTGNPYESTFTYACARADMTGRGLLGFTQQTVTDPQTGIVQTSNFLQTFPDIGLVSSETKVLGSVTLNSTVNSYGVLTPTSTPTALPWTGTGIVENAPQFPFVSQTVVSGNDLPTTTYPNGAPLPSATTTDTYNAYGNAMTVTTVKSDGTSQATTNTYQAPDLTHWFLDRLSTSTVTSTSP